MNELVFANLTQRPTRSLASVVGIALGVVLIVVIVGLARGMVNSSAERESRVGAEIMFQKHGSFSAGLTATPLSLPVPYAGALAELDGVARTTPVGRYMRSGAGGIGFELIEGVSFDATSEHASYPSVTGISIIEGRSPRADGAYELVIDRIRAEDQGQTVGDSLHLMGHEFEIVGLFGPEVGSRIKMPLATMQDLLGNPSKASWILVKASDPTEQVELAQRIDARFPGHQLLLTRDIPGLYERGIPSLGVFLDVVVGLALVISSLVILLAMYTAVTERTREIGILRALGARRQRIVLLVVREALLLSGLGVALGLGLATLAGAIIMERTSLIVELQPGLMLGATLIALVGGALGGLYPALHAARRDPVEALAYE